MFPVVLVCGRTKMVGDWCQEGWKKKPAKSCRIWKQVYIICPSANIFLSLHFWADFSHVFHLIYWDYCCDAQLLKLLGPTWTVLWRQLFFWRTCQILKQSMPSMRKYHHWNSQCVYVVSSAIALSSCVIVNRDLITITATLYHPVNISTRPQLLREHVLPLPNSQRGHWLRLMLCVLRGSELNCCSYSELHSFCHGCAQFNKNQFLTMPASITSETFWSIDLFFERKFTSYTK